MAERFTAKQFIDAIPNTGGVISEIAARVGCSWNTAKKYLGKYPTVEQAWQDERERITDLARHNIIVAIELDGDLQMSKWWLQVMDAEFNPAQKHEISGADGQPLEVKFVNDWRGKTSDASPGTESDTSEPRPVQVAGGGSEVAQDNPGDASSS